MSDPSAGKPSIWVAVVVSLAVMIVGYVAFLMFTDQHLAYQAKSLSPQWWRILPRSVSRTISDGGFIGTLTAVTMNVLHLAVASMSAFLATTLALGSVAKPRQSLTAALPAITEGNLECAIEGAKQVVILPKITDRITGEELPITIDENPYNQVFMRCDRGQVSIEIDETNPIHKLTLAALQILVAHDDVPASCGAHHADATLKDHSIEIGKAVCAYMERMGWEDPLSMLAGITHDMDKLLAYSQKGGQWVKTNKATHHNSYSAFVVAQQPEFTLLSKQDQHVLTMVLRYYHHPQLLPLEANERINRLIQALRIADGMVIRSEKKEGVATARSEEGTETLIQDAFMKFIATADINKKQGSALADGWSVAALDVVMIPMSTILSSIGAFLPLTLTRQLQLGVDVKSYRHPAISLILDSLDAMGFLCRCHGSVEAPSGLFDIRVGGKNFRACILIDKDALAGLLPSAVGQWGSSEFKIKIRCETPEFVEPAKN